MDKFNREIMKILLDDEAALLKELQSVYSAALADIKRNVKWLMTDEMSQSKVYQLEYQQQLEKRINTILEMTEDMIENNSYHFVKNYKGFLEMEVLLHQYP